VNSGRQTRIVIKVLRGTSSPCSAVGSEEDVRRKQKYSKSPAYKRRKLISSKRVMNLQRQRWGGGACVVYKAVIKGKEDVVRCEYISIEADCKGWGGGRRQRVWEKKKNVRKSQMGEEETTGQVDFVRKTKVSTKRAGKNKTFKGEGWRGEVKMTTGWCENGGKGNPVEEQRNRGHGTKGTQAPTTRRSKPRNSRPVGVVHEKDRAYLQSQTRWASKV